MMKRSIMLVFLFLPGLLAMAQERKDSLALDSLIQTLPDVMVKGDYPMVKVNGGALVYDIQRITERKPVTNAYDALKELPGVMEMDGKLTLSGQQVTVIVNGKTTSLSREQLTQLLKSMPKEQLRDVEVMYNAPARYQVKGACLNLNLARQTSSQPMWSGEAFAQYDQSHDATYEQRATVVYAGKRLSADILYDHKHGDIYSTMDNEAIHTLADGSARQISALQRSRERFHTHQWRASMKYQLADNHSLELTYNGAYATSHSRQDNTGTIVADYRLRSRNWLHDLALDYALPFGLSLGAEYTYYKVPKAQWLHSVMTDRDLDYLSESEQRLRIWKFYLKQRHSLERGWGVNYGVTYSTSEDDSYQRYTPTGESTATLPSDLATSNREHVADIYTGLTKRWGDKLTLDVSMNAEYYHNMAWNEWDWQPTVNLTYLPAQGHVLQLGFNTYSIYPEYWAIQNFTGYTNGGYGEVSGNPNLKPATNYNAQLTYVLHNKYVLRAWFTHTDDFFTQTLYQQPDRLVETFRVVNFDKEQQAGLMASAPLRLGNWYGGNLTAIGLWMRHQDSDFYDIPYDRHRVLGVFTFRNDFHLRVKPEITLSVNGSLRTKSIQADYDLPASGSVDAALQCRFWNKRATVRLFCSDLFQTSQIDPYIDYKGQRVNIDFSCYRHFGVSFSYALGGYQEKQHQEVDTSRFLK